MVPYTAGAMFSTMHTHTLPSHDASTSRPSPQPRRKTVSPTASTQQQQPEKKPKKANSELRKQQNRIASRNYREKRKRKLQYLQQLIRDGGSSSPAGKPADKSIPGGDQRQQQALSQKRTLSPNVYPQQDTSRPNTSHTITSDNSRTTILYPSNHYPQTFPQTTNSTSYAPNTSYAHFEPQPSHWTTTSSMYDIPAPLDIPPWNNLPSTPWIPNIDFSPPMTTRSADDFQFTPPPPAPPQLAFPPLGPTGFEHQHQHQHQHNLPTPPRQAHTPEPDFYFASVGGAGGGNGGHGNVFAEGRRLPLDVQGGSISLPSSPFCYPR